MTSEPPQYELLERIGSGAFGEVYVAKHVHSGTRCAIKRLRVYDDGQLRVLPAAQFHEIEALRQLEHPNIVKLLDVFADGAYLSLVFELVEADLFSIIRHRCERFDDADIRGLMRMLLHAVAHCHAKSILHRDLKPGNILLDARGVLKLSDFGLATVFVGTAKSYSHQVATRWYRAPELLFGSRQYDAAVDMWGVGAIFAELLRAMPLFPGQNDIDQLYRIIQVLGSPELQWSDAQSLPDFEKVSFPPYTPIPLARVFPDASSVAVDLLTNLLALDPKKRLTAQQALMHPFFFAGPLHLRLRVDIETRKSSAAAASKDGESVDDPFLTSLGEPLILL